MAVLLFIPSLGDLVLGGESGIQENKIQLAGIIFSSEKPLVLNEGSMLLDAQPIVNEVTQENKPDLLDGENTQFAGEYGDEDIFFAVCGMEINASFPGLITDTGEPEKWNEGKGGYVTIQNAYSLRNVVFSHFSEVSVTPGDFVELGESLGTAGSSGNVFSGRACQVGIANK